jgi:hypothetical protein
MKNFLVASSTIAPNFTKRGDEITDCDFAIAGVWVGRNV